MLILTRSRHRGHVAALVVSIGALGLLAASASPAAAAGGRFGTQEYLRPIQDVAIKGPNGEALYLGHKFSFYSFFLPYSLSDDGYILGVKGRDQYIRLDPASIARFQAGGQLPSPLPKYELSAVDYAFGHLAWGAPAFIVVIVAIVARTRRRRQRAHPYIVSALRHGERGDLDQAIADYTKAIEIEPKLEVALLNRGGMHERRGDYDQAIADFTQAIKMGPRKVTVVALVNRGIAYQKKGDFDRAIADQTQAIETAEVALAYFNRGNAFAGKGDYARAIADYTKAIKLEPNAAPAYRARGRAYEAQGEADLAQADYNAGSEIAARQGTPPR